MKNGILTYFGLILSFYINSQTILDGVYFNETPLRVKPIYIDKRIPNGDWVNENFQVTDLKNSNDTFPTTPYKKYKSPPLKINDCIFFNPIDFFITNQKKALENKSVFTLSAGPRLNYGERFDAKIILPNSIRFYTDTHQVSIARGSTQFLLDSNFFVPLNHYLKPFYFRKFEVSNKEYREFVEWVRDSIFRQALAQEYDEKFYLFVNSNGDSLKEPRINWKMPIDLENAEVKEILEANFYVFSTSPLFSKRELELDIRKLDYEINDAKGKIVDVVNVYPDTLCWINDFTSVFNEPMANMYFWHPNYDNYPVVGISFYQAKAFLHWKTQMLQKELDSKDVKFKVSLDLPSAAIWDMVSTSKLVKNKPILFPENYHYISNSDWLTDLKIDHQIDQVDSVLNSKKYKISIHYNDELSRKLNQDVKFDGNLIINDGSIHTSVVIENQNKKVTARDIKEFKIHYLDGNVSEWLIDSYDKAWKPIWSLRRQQMSFLKGKGARILSEIEEYYHKDFNADDKMVVGANWYDERFSNKLGKNIAGLNCKTFVNPREAHSTIGFRYVIYFEEKVQQ